MINSINTYKKYKAILFVFLLAFTLVAGFADYFHNHAPGEHAPDCPVFLIHYFFNTEAAGYFILFFHISAVFLTLSPASPFPAQTILVHFLNRAPPVSFRTI